MVEIAKKFMEWFVKDDKLTFSRARKVFSLKLCD